MNTFFLAVAGILGTYVILELIAAAIKYLSARRKLRPWHKPERQLEHLRNMVQGDHWWLSHDKTARALTARYMAALAPDWYEKSHADQSNFRREIGLEPRYGHDWTKGA